MNELWDQLSGAWATRVAAIGAAAGGVAGGGIYLSASGIVLGIITVLGVLGMLGVLAAAVAAFTGSDEPVLAVAAVPPTASAAAQAMELMKDEAEMLSAGRFAEYHLSKAKALFAAGNMKEAAYQAGASLAHDDLPEAFALRKTALAGGR